MESIDLFCTFDYLRYQILLEEFKALPEHQKKSPIIIDEIQKIPELLDVVHLMMEDYDAQFILCGSSARKLRNQREEINLLGGRAKRFELAPLIWKELGSEFDLLKAMNHGLISQHYLSNNYQDLFRA